MASETELQNLRSVLERIKSFTPARLIQRPEWGSLTFEDIKSDIEDSYRLVDKLNSLPFQVLPDTQIKPITAALGSLFANLQSIDQFSLRTPGESPDDVRRRIASSFQNAARNSFSIITPWLPVILVMGNDAEMLAPIRRIQDASDDALKAIKGTQKELEVIVSATRQAAAIVGVAGFWSEFETSAKKQNRAAGWWLLWTCLSLAVLVALAFIMWKYAEKNLDQGQIIQKISTKLVVLASLLSATIWCGRNYKALKHQAAINSHRATSAKVFEAFAKAAKDPQTQDAVLLEATRAVFANVPTGYIDGGNGDNDVKLVEVVRSILPNQAGKS